jgi:adenylylsulfate kinase
MTNNKISSNVVWQQSEISRNSREKMNRHCGAVLWFTGLSGSGKSTLAHAVEKRLYQMNVRTYVLDGDNVRHGLCGDLGFSDIARRENIRRIGEVSKLFVDAGMIVLTAFISPFKEDRAVVRKLYQVGDFIEIYCAASLDVCIARDVKGLYQRARQGEIKDFTGVSSPYEAPENAELIIDTSERSLDESVELVIGALNTRNVLQV